MRSAVTDESPAEATMDNLSEINLPKLPESCISTILSINTPRDVCRLSVVYKLFRSAADGDSLWNKFIPQQCYQILPRAVTPVAFSSRRELYFCLCDSILIDGRTQIQLPYGQAFIHILVKQKQRFWLERSIGKIGYMLSETELSIEWGNDQRYWRWVSRDDSRTIAAKAIYLFAAEISLCARDAELKRQKALEDATELLRKEKEKQQKFGRSASELQSSFAHHSS